MIAIDAVEVIVQIGAACIDITAMELYAKLESLITYRAFAHSPK